MKQCVRSVTSALTAVDLKCQVQWVLPSHDLINSFVHMILFCDLQSILLWFFSCLPYHSSSILFARTLSSTLH